MKIKEFVKKHEKIKRVAKILINISMLPIMIPIGIIMNIRKILLTPKSRQTDAIGVLGRGISLTEADRLDFLDDFIVANITSQELKTEPIRSLLKGKRIINFINIGEGMLHPWYLMKYNVYKYVINRFKPNGSSVRIRSPRNEYATEWFGFKTDLLPEEMAPYLEGVSSTGLVAVTYAAIALQKKDIYVVGIDFYEADYLTKPLENRLESRDTCDKMMRFVTSLIAKCPGTNFHFITASSFKCSLPNVKVHNIKPRSCSV